MCPRKTAALKEQMIGGAELHNLINAGLTHPDLRKNPHYIRVVNNARRDPKDELALPEKISCTTDDSQVYQYNSNPPCFIISASFRGAKRLAQELGMPDDPDQTYYSRLWGGGEFTGTVKKDFDFYQKYTVETFGLRVDSVPSDYPFTEPFFQLPFEDLLGIQSDLPRYWLTSSSQIVQVWRTRVLPRPLSDVQANIDCPFTDRILTTLYFEERWHPEQWDTLTMGGPTLRHESSALEIKNFFSTARRILGRDHQRMGRRQGSRQYPPGEFKALVTTIYFQLWEELGVPPNQDQVADKLSFSVSGLRDNWALTRKPWPPTRPTPS